MKRVKEKIMVETSMSIALAEAMLKIQEAENLACQEEIIRRAQNMDVSKFTSFDSSMTKEEIRAKFMVLRELVKKV